MGRAGRKLRSRRLRIAIIAAATATLVLAGCGNDKTETKSSAASAGTAGAEVTAAAAKDIVATLTDPSSDRFDYKSYIPTSSVTPKAGAKIAVIAAALASPVVTQYSNDVIDAAKVAGYNPVAFDGKFQVETQSALVQQAVQQKYDGIVLVGIVPDTIVTPLAAAKAANIPVVSFDGYGDGANGVTDIGIDPAAAGVAIANWIIADSDGKAKVLAATFPPGVSGGA
jgi:ABC-type sugar transport system substrate-binding protein